MFIGICLRPTEPIPQHANLNVLALTILSVAVSHWLQIMSIFQMKLQGYLLDGRVRSSNSNFLQETILACKDRRELVIYWEESAIY